MPLLSVRPSGPNRRALAGLLAMATACAVVAPAASARSTRRRDGAPALPATPAGSGHDFDFEHGRWQTSLRRLLHPLSGSDLWTDYTGTTVVTPLCGGRANI